jgi:hypothetical protein
MEVAGLSRAAVLALRGIVVNAGALLVCDLALDGFVIQGLRSYVWGAVALEVPTVAFLAIVNFWFASSTMNKLAAIPRPLGAIWLGGTFALVFAIPLLLSTCLPGLLLAEWLAPHLSITGAWTYVAACVITVFLLLSTRQLRALMWYRGFVRRPVDLEPS